MKKYLIIGDCESPHTIKWAKELSRYFEVYLVSSKGISPEAKDFLPDERIFTFNLRIAESGTNVKFLRMLIPLIRILRKIKPDYLNAHYITSYGVLAALSKKLSGRQFVLIQTAWGTDILVTPFRNKFYKSITRFALNAANLITSDSVAVTKIVGDLTSTPTTTFPFGLQEIPEASCEIKDPNLFFSNRTLNENSNIDRVLHFFSKLRDANKDARLVIANVGPLKSELIKLSEELGMQESVDFVGFISPDQQNDYYRKSRFYFSILSSDALSVSLIEAMSFGCIPLVSDLPDNRDWVTDGINGIIMKEDTRADTILAFQGDAQKIFISNRQLVAERAIFPKAIEDFCQTLSTL
ncbi:MAG: hypothetical protein DRI97_04100 [Bacteroidetes bacterium]|nr:MAG: hypothetical protein DRI97_04100 [Bacteroidota bacterium]